MRTHIQNVVVAVLLGVFLAAARADAPKEKFELKLKLSKGEKRAFETIQDMKNHISVSGQSFDMNTKMTLDTEVEVTDVADGITTLEIVHKRVQMAATGGPLEMKYDSEDPTTTNNLLGQKLNGLVGKTVATKFDSSGKLKADQDGKAALPDQLKESISEMFSALPSKPVAIGDSWEHEYKITSDPTMPMDIAVKQTLQEVRNGVAYIKVEAKITGTTGIKGTLAGDTEVDQKTGVTTSTVLNMEAEGKQGGADFKIDGVLSMKVK